MKTNFLFLLLIGILLSVQVWAESQSMRKQIILKTATNTSQGTPRSVDPASWIIACYDVEDSKLFIDIPVPCGTLTVSVSDSLTGEGYVVLPERGKELLFEEFGNTYDFEEIFLTKKRSCDLRDEIYMYKFKKK